MNFEFSAQDEQFRQQVKDFLAGNLSDEIKQSTAKTTTVFVDKDIALKWQNILAERGWVAPLWPEQWGGTGWTPSQNYIFVSECAKAGAPSLIPLGLRMLGPVLLRYGTQQQKQYYLPKIISGEHYWCQGYSEPGSGSDLASLKCKAQSDGDNYIVNGTKIWTTHAHFADHIFCLVRTDSSGKPQHGISFLLIDMATPGITVDPIITMAGDHEVNQVFFEDVVVPKANLVGPEHQGWTVAKCLLEFERGGGIAAAGLKAHVNHVRNIASNEHLGSGLRLIDEAHFSGTLAEAEIALNALEFTELKIMSQLSRGGNPGPESSALKNISVSIHQKLEELAVEASAYYAAPHGSLLPGYDNNLPVIGPDYVAKAMPRYLNGRAASVFGGAKEVQKNIIAKVVLGL